MGEYFDEYFLKCFGSWILAICQHCRRGAKKGKVRNGLLNQTPPSFKGSIAK